MLTKLTDIQKLLRNTNVLTCFSGKFSQGLIEELGEAVKKHLEGHEISKNNIFAVFSIFIEQTQNIKNYMATKQDSEQYNYLASSSIVCIGKDMDEYFVWSGNLVENKDIGPLENKLKLVSTSNKDELKRLYKEQLKKEYDPEKSGAGIGLIDISRKASKPIEYSFEEIDENYSYYEIKVII